jgi:chromosome segregation ATPase
MKKRDKRDYIIAFQTAVCAILITLLIRENTGLKDQMSDLEDKSQKAQSALKMKNAALSSQNTLKGIRIESLEKQLEAISSSANKTGEINSIDTLKKLSKRTDQLNKATKEKSQLEKSLKEISHNANMQVDQLSEEIEKLKTALANERYKNKSTTKYKKTTYKPKKTSKKMTTSQLNSFLSRLKKKSSSSTYRKPANTKKGVSKYRYSDKDQVELLGDMFEK